MAAAPQAGQRANRLLQASHTNCRHAFKSSSGALSRRLCPRQLHSVSHPRTKQNLLRTAASESFGASDAGEPSEEAEERSYEVFPRLRERDPYRRLGLRRDVSFEEVIDAKNYLIEQYKWHAQSRESIELAFDTVIQDKLKARNKFGFRPPRTGRRTDAIGDPLPKTPLERFLALFDPSVTLQTITSEGIIYAGLAAWAFLTRDVSLPLAASFLYAVYRIFSKRKLLNPDGPYFGGTPIFGAIFAGGCSLAVGGLTATAVVKGLTMVTQVSPFLVLIIQAIITILTTGLLSICLR